MVWFLSLGLLGLHSVISDSWVLGMFSPHWAIQFIYHHPIMTFFVMMGAVVLTVTGGEALLCRYGTFRTSADSFSWFFVVLPCLVLNYAGGALLLRDPAAIENPFYLWFRNGHFTQ